MKKLLCLICALLMIVVCFAGCGGKKTISASKAIEEPDSVNGAEITFTVGFDAEFPPYGYLDTETNEYTGFDLVLAEEVCKRCGWTLVKKPSTWELKDSELETGTIDCIWNGFTMNGREDDYTFSSPYVDNSQVVVVRKADKINTLDDLAGKTLEVQKESSAEKALTATEDNEKNLALVKSLKELKSVADYNTALMDLESGICDAVAMDIGVAQYKVAANAKLEMLSETVATEQYAIGFKRGNLLLCDKVEATLDAMVEDGTFQKIADEWELSDCVCLK